MHPKKKEPKYGCDLLLPDAEIEEDPGSHASLEEELMELLKENSADNNEQLSSDAEEEENAVSALVEFGEDKGYTQPQASSSENASMQEIERRIEAYRSVVASITDEGSDNARVRRYMRTIDLLEDLKLRSSSGLGVKAEELPPMPPGVFSSTTTAPQKDHQLEDVADKLAIKSSDKQEASSAARQLALDFINPPTSQKSEGLDMLKYRHREYKLAAIEARDSGQISRAKALLMASKYIAEAIENIEAGKETFDPDTMPPPPSEFEGLPDEMEAEPAPIEKGEVAEPNQIMFTPIICPENISQRINYYKMKIAEEEEDSSKRRRLIRIMNTHEEALKACQKGVTTYNYEDLAPPPGCPSLNDRSKLSISRKSSNAAIKTASKTQQNISGGIPSTFNKTQATVTTLKERQLELRNAAIKSKQLGDMDLAKKYLRSCLSMKQMIQAAEAGLPIDMKQVPRAPYFNAPDGPKPIFSGERCEPPIQYAEALVNTSGNLFISTIKTILEKQEEEVNELCTKHNRLGEFDSAANLKKLLEANEISKSVLNIRLKQKQALSHYFEYVNLPQLNMNPDLGENILEIIIVRGISYHLPTGFTKPSQLNTYVEIQMQLSSSDSAEKLSTDWCNHTNEPVYKQSITTFNVNMKSRAYQRFIQSNRCLKATVYYDRGPLRRSGVLGTVDVPLNGLVQSAKSTVVRDLMEGRKPVGGRLVVQLRQRTSIYGDTLIYEQKPWLIIPPKSQRISTSPTHQLQQPSSRTPTIVLEKTPRGSSSTRSNTPPVGTSNKFCSLGMYEAKRQIYQNKLDSGKLSPTEASDLECKLEKLQQDAAQLKRRLANPDSTEFRREYYSELQSHYDAYRKKYEDSKQRGDSDRAGFYFYWSSILKKDLELAR